MPRAIELTDVCVPYAAVMATFAVTLLVPTSKTVVLLGLDLPNAVPATVAADPPPSADAEAAWLRWLHSTAAPASCTDLPVPPKSTQVTCGNGHVAWAVCRSAPVFGESGWSAIAAALASLPSTVIFPM